MSNDKERNKLIDRKIKYLKTSKISDNVIKEYYKKYNKNDWQSIAAVLNAYNFILNAESTEEMSVYKKVIDEVKVMTNNNFERHFKETIDELSNQGHENLFFVHFDNNTSSSTFTYISNYSTENGYPDRENIITESQLLENKEYYKNNSMLVYTDDIVATGTKLRGLLKKFDDLHFIAITYFLNAELKSNIAFKKVTFYEKKLIKVISEDLLKDKILKLYKEDPLNEEYCLNCAISLNLYSPDNNHQIYFANKNDRTSLLIRRVQSGHKLSKKSFESIQYNDFKKVIEKTLKDLNLRDSKKSTNILLCRYLIYGEHYITKIEKEILIESPYMNEQFILIDEYRRIKTKLFKNLEQHLKAIHMIKE